MSRFFLLLILFISFGCSQKTTLVLLPDETGKTGKALLQTERGEVVVDKPYTYTSVSGSAGTPAAPKNIDPEEISNRFGDLLQAQPPQPQSFTLYFLPGSTLLTEESLQKVPEVIAAMDQDAPIEINIIGHSDSVGKEEYNLRLSLNRATAVKRLLQKEVPRISNVYVQSYGENDPLVATADGVAEPRNRRVEILVR